MKLFDGLQYAGRLFTGRQFGGPNGVAPQPPQPRNKLAYALQVASLTNDKARNQRLAELLKEVDDKAAQIAELQAKVSRLQKRLAKLPEPAEPKTLIRYVYKDRPPEPPDLTPVPVPAFKITPAFKPANIAPEVPKITLAEQPAQVINWESQRFRRNVDFTELKTRLQTSAVAGPQSAPLLATEKLSLQELKSRLLASTLRKAAEQATDLAALKLRVTESAQLLDSIRLKALQFRQEATNEQA